MADQANVGRVDKYNWIRIGRYDDARRRSLWLYYPPLPPDVTDNPPVDAIILRAGREGDDAYVELRPSDFTSPEKWRDFEDAIGRARYAAEEAMRVSAQLRVLDSDERVRSSVELMRRLVDVFAAAAKEADRIEVEQTPAGYFPQELINAVHRARYEVDE
jgi:hypothetical protein